tara:strand:- start:50 stop:853 length:804 start_codon:yes stop_codon:yes gene_type:complete
MIVTIKNVVNDKQQFGLVDTKTGKMRPKYDNCKDVWIPGMSSTNGSLNTGLDAKSEKEWEKKLFLSEGSLQKNSPYWNDFKILIPEKGLVLNTEEASDLFKLELMKADPFVAAGLGVITVKSEYVITSEEGVAKTGNSKRDILAKAYKAYATMSAAEINDALFMFGKDGNHLTPEVAKNRLGDVLEENPAKFSIVLDDIYYKDKVWFMKLIKAGIVKKHGVGKGTEMPLYYEDIMLGNGLVEAIAYVKADDNQKIYTGLKLKFKDIK